MRLWVGPSTVDEGAGRYFVVRVDLVVNVVVEEEEEVVNEVGWTGLKDVLVEEEMARPLIFIERESAMLVWRF